jgi:hypothetical protein
MLYAAPAVSETTDPLPMAVSPVVQLTGRPKSLKQRRLETGCLKLRLEGPGKSASGAPQGLGDGFPLTKV